MPTIKDERFMSPQELFDLQLKKGEEARERQEVINDLAEEERAIEQGLDSTATGKPIRRHGSPKNYGGDKEQLKNEFGQPFALNVGPIVGILPAVQQLMAGSKQQPQITQSFGKGASQIQNTGRHEDKDYIYDTADVSQPAFDLLMKEADTIQDMLKQAEAIHDPAMRQQKMLDIQLLAGEYEMRLHPITQRYVHDINRVNKTERTLNRSNRLQSDQKIYIFLLKSEADSLRGIKSKVGDQYDQNPQEAISSGDHLKAPAPHVS